MSARMATTYAARPLLEGAWRGGCLSGRPTGWYLRGVSLQRPVPTQPTMKLNKLTIVLATLALVSLAFAQRIHI